MVAGMDREYHLLPSRELGAGAGLHRPGQALATKVVLESPALEVMTDLKRATPATIGCRRRSPERTSS